MKDFLQFGKRTICPSAYLAICLLILAAGSARGSIAILSGANGHVYCSGNCTTSAINTTGATLLVIVAVNTTTITAPTDSKSNTWTPVGQQYSDTDAYAEIFYAYNPTVGTGHTFSQTASGETIFVSAYSGTNTTSGVLISSASSTSGSKRTSASAAPTPWACAGLVVAGWGGDTSSTGIGSHNMTALDTQSSQAEYGSDFYAMSTASPDFAAYFYWTTSQYAVEVVANFAPAQQNCTASPQETVGALPTKVGLQGWWTLDEGSGSTAYDSSGNNATGTWYGNQVGTSGYYSVGVVGPYCGTFDGSTDYISVPTGSFSMSSYASSGFTASVWANITNTSTNRCLLQKGSGAYAGPFDTYSSGTQMVFLVGNGVNGNTQSISTATGVVSAGVWQHWAFVFDGQKTSIYCNGALKAGPTTINVAVADAGNALRIGERLDGGTIMYGLIDDPRIYSRALSASEISLLYSQASETFGTMDSPSRATALARTDTETLSPSDSAARLATLARTDAETFSPSDLAARLATLRRTGMETFSPGDSVTRLATLTRTDAEALSPNDSVTRLATLARTDAEALNPSDSVARLAGFNRVAAEAFSPSDSATRLATLARTGAEALSPSDLVARLAGFSRAPTEAFSPGDSATRLATLARTAAEALSPSDSAARLAGFSRAPTETSSPSDSAARLAGFNRAPIEVLSPGDSATRLATLARTGAETFSPSDSPTRNAGFNRAPSEALSPGDSAARIAGFNRAPNDALSPGDSVVRIAGLRRNPGESLSFAEYAGRLVAFFRQGQETLPESEGVTALWNFGRPQARHESAVPGRGKSGEAPGRAKSGEVPGRTKSGTVPPH